MFKQFRCIKLSSSTHINSVFPLIPMILYFKYFCINNPKILITPNRKNKSEMLHNYFFLTATELRVPNSRSSVVLIIIKTILYNSPEIVKF